jgi:hypothetical protein
MRGDDQHLGTTLSMLRVVRMKVRRGGFISGEGGFHELRHCHRSGFLLAVNPVETKDVLTHL